MKGNNTININQATMVQAIQHWLESQFMPGKVPTVVKVTGQKDGGYNDPTAFEVETESVEAECAPKNPL